MNEEKLEDLLIVAWDELDSYSCAIYITGILEGLKLISSNNFDELELLYLICLEKDINNA